MHMTKLAIASAVAVALSSIAAAPAVAQESQIVVSYGDLDLNTAAGVQTLDARLEASVKAVCGRPDVRDLKSGLAYEQCKDAAMNSAHEQLARQGARIAAN
jgi:UrcA family protein